VHKVGNKIECNNMHGERIKTKILVVNFSRFRKNGSKVQEIK